MRQVEAIKQNKPLLVVGTPGRLAELSRTGALQTHTASLLVLDEVRSDRPVATQVPCPLGAGCSCSRVPMHPWLAAQGRTACPLAGAQPFSERAGPLRS